MHHYPFHIGDYRSSTAHLSNEEDLAYRRLIDFYMDTEEEIPLETHWVARRIRVDSEAIKTVLNDFFICTETGWKHARCDAEIARYRDMANRNRINGLKGGRPKVKNPVGSQSKPTGKPTRNQEPRTNNIKKPEFVSEEVWNDFINHRKTRKSSVTDRVVSSIEKEAKKAGWSLEDALTEIVTRGWTSFKADWVTKQQQQEVNWE